MEILGQIMELAYKVNTEKRATVFVEYMGHVDKCDMRVFLGGWRSGGEPSIHKETYHCSTDMKTLQDMLDTLQGIYDSDGPVPVKVHECSLCRCDIMDGDDYVESGNRILCARCVAELQEVLVSA